MFNDPRYGFFAGPPQDESDLEKFARMRERARREKKLREQAEAERKAVEGQSHTVEGQQQANAEALTPRMSTCVGPLPEGEGNGCDASGGKSEGAEREREACRLKAELRTGTDAQQHGAGDCSVAPVTAGDSRKAEVERQSNTIEG